nr:hypothetical protein [Tanacetum cinerariifolium]
MLSSKIPKFDFDFEEEIRLIENLLYDNSFPRPPKELYAEIADTIIESIPLPIPVQDGEADLFLSDDSIPPGIENPDMIAEEISDKLNEDKCFDPGREINVSTKIEDDDYFPFTFVIRFFLPYFIFPEVSPLSLSAENEDTIFDPGLSPMIEASCVGYCPVSNTF